LSNSKAKLSKSIIDKIREQEIKERKLAGQDRINFSGISYDATLQGGSGRRDTDPNVTSQFSFLRTDGTGTMVGVLSLYPTAVTISSGVIDISSATSGKYSSYVTVNGEGSTDDTLATITGAEHAGQMIILQPNTVTQLTLTEGGNIELPNGVDVVINTAKDGASTATLIFDTAIAGGGNKWILMATSELGAGSSEFQDSTFRIYDDIDNTRKGAFQTGGISASTTRTLTFPDASGVIAVLDGGSTQVFNDDIDITRSNATATFTLEANHTTPADGNQISNIDSIDDDSGGNPTTYSRMQTVIQDPTNTTEDGEWVFSLIRGGTLSSWIILNQADNNNISFFRDLAMENNDITNVATILVNGLATFNGDVSLGNASTDDVSMTGQFASNVTFNDTFDILFATNAGNEIGTLAKKLGKLFTADIDCNNRLIIPVGSNKFD